jgi:hypothetical protein
MDIKLGRNYSPGEMGKGEQHLRIAQRATPSNW